MTKQEKRLRKQQDKMKRFVSNLEILHKLGYEPKQQKCWYQFKDRNLMFYPTTGSYFDEYTRKKGLIAELPERATLTLELRPVKNRCGQEVEKHCWLFSEFSLPQNQLPEDDQLYLPWF